MRIAVIGATGQVGTIIRSVLAERDFPVDDIRFLASARSVGRRLPWAGGRSTSKTPPSPTTGASTWL